MQLLIKNARIIDGTSEHQPQDILIKNGLIAEIGANIPLSKDAQVWESKNLCVSPGWMDVGVQICDPGFEHREDMRSAVSAAEAGGFTAIACMPNTSPALHSKSEILYVKNKSEGLKSPVTVHPIGAISLGCEGKDLAELMDMNNAGAVAFSDGSKAIQDAGLLLRAIQYARSFNGMVFNEPYYKSIASGGQMHEGKVSTSLGLRGIPALAEELMVQRDLSLLDYSGGRLHIHLISTANSVAMIRAAKKAGKQVTCSVAIANLCFTDEKMVDFDSYWKIQPPLRSQDDKKTLLQGLADGTIDFICSNHTPWDEEAKNLEFPFAKFGMLGLETAFALCRTFLPKSFSLNDLVEKLSLAPRRLLGLPVPEIAKGAIANLTVFDPDQEWTFEANYIKSKSKNSPFIGQKFKGKVIGIINNEQ
ncbi:MAG: dihydroorotase [Saprospiraceae bacterium]|nr:dihydroorotase [Saprospiraceae bacterium]MCB9344839.1 dihydroorotase [Lewinellaceae bacterium]